MKVVINTCFGEFSLSKEAYEMLGKDWDRYGFVEDGMRTNPDLISVVEKLGSERASGSCAELEVIDIPDDATDWELNEYDGVEDIIYVVGGKIRHLF